MAINQYFKTYDSTPQQDLVDGLVKEVIQMNGQDVLYLPRSTIKKDDILGEDTLNTFETAFQIEMYLNTTDGFGGSGDQLTKFGLDVQDEIIFTVSRERFKKEVVNIGNIPREGDLIYLPLNKGLFEIKFVEHEKPFYSLGKNYVFEITCEKFVYSNEKFIIPPGQMGAIFNKIERQYVTTISLEVTNGDGTYLAGEEIFQGIDAGTATARAYVGSFNEVTNVLSIYNEIGTFQAIAAMEGEIHGVQSGTTREFVNRDDQDSPNTPFADNKAFETEGDDILDFSEIDPWAEGDL